MLSWKAGQIVADSVPKVKHIMHSNKEGSIVHEYVLHQCSHALNWFLLLMYWQTNFLHIAIYYIGLCTTYAGAPGKKLTSRGGMTGEQSCLGTVRNNCAKCKNGLRFSTFV